MTEADHSLRTMLEFDMTYALDDIDLLGQSIIDLEDKFRQLSDGVGKFDLNIAKKISEELKKFEGNKMVLDGKDIRNMLEESISRSLMKNGIEFSSLGKDGKAQPFKVSLTKDVWQDLERKVRDAMRESAKGVQVSSKPLKPITISLNSNEFDNVRKELATQIRHAIDNNIKFKWHGGIDMGKQDSLATFNFEPSDIQKVVNAFRDELVKEMSKRKNIEFKGDFPKIIIPTNFIHETIQTINEEIVKSQGEIKDVVAAFEKMPDMKTDVEKLQAGILKSMQQLMIFQKAISNLSLIENEEDINKFLKELSELRITILNKAVVMIRDLSVKLQQMPLSPVELATYQNEFEKIVDIINKRVVETVREATRQVQSQLGFKLVLDDNGDVVAKSIAEIQDRIRDATKKAIDNLDKMKGLDIDTNLIKKTMDDFANWANNKLNEELRKSLRVVSKDILLKNRDVMDKFAQDLADIIVLKFDEEEIRGLSITLDVPFEKLVPELKRALQKAINNFVRNNVKVADIIEFPEMPTVTLPKYVMNDIAKVVRDGFKSAAIQMVEATKGKKFSLADTDRENLDKWIDEQAKQLIRNVLTSVRSSLNNLGKERDLNIDTSLVKQTMEEFANWANTKLNDELKRSLNNISRDIMSKNKEIMDKFANNLAEVVNIRFDEGELKGTAIDLHISIKPLVDDIQKQLQRAVNRFIRERVDVAALLDFPEMQSVKIPKYVMNDVTKVVKDAFMQTVKDIVSTLKGKNYVLTDEERTSLRNWMDEQSKQVMRNVLSGARLVIQDLGNQVEKGRVRGLTNEENEQVVKQLNQSLNKIYNAYTDNLKSVLRFYITTAQVFSELKKEFNEEINEISKLAQTMTSVLDIREKTDQALRKLAKKLEQSIKNAIDDYKPVFPTLNNETISTTMIEPLEKGIAEFIKSVGRAIATTNPRSVRAMLRPLSNSLQDYLRNHISSIADTVRGAQTDMVLSMKRFHTDVQKRWATAAGYSSVRELRRAHPTISGEENIQKAMNANMQLLVDRFNQAMQTNLKNQMDISLGMFRQITIQPDIEPVHFLTRKMRDLQQDIVKKVKEMITEQFNAMTDELRRIQMATMSIGATPPKAPTPQASGGGGGSKDGSGGGGFDRESLDRGRYGFHSFGSSGGYGGGGNSRWFPTPNPYGSGGSFQGIEPGGDTHSFLGSVVNTMRYITAGTLIGVPYAMYREAFTSAKEFDYQLAKAQQNFLIKDLVGAATRRLVDEMGLDNFARLSESERKRLIDEEVYDLKYMARDGAVPYLQNIALAYGINQEEVGKGWHIASRRYDDPSEALAMTREVAKVRGIEDVDVEEAAKGFEAIGSQWDLTGYDMNHVANMMIKAANISQATIEDMLVTQQRAGALFRRNLPLTTAGEPMTKKEGLATAIALSSMFAQATARSGGEGGTFFKAILERPFTKHGRAIMEEYSQKKGFEFLNPWLETEDGTKIQKGAIQTIGAIIEASRMMDDASQKDFLKTLFPAWHEPTMGALSNFMQDLERDFERIAQITATLTGKVLGEDISVADAIEMYVQEIMNADENTAQQIQAGMMDTWRYKTQSAKTVWQISTFGVFDEFKDEFGQVITYLTAFLKAVKDNSGLVSNLIELISKVAVGAAGAWAYGKMKTFIDDKRRHRLGNRYDEWITALNEEGRLINTRKNAVGMLYFENLNRQNESAKKLKELENEEKKIKNELAQLDQQNVLLSNRESLANQLPDGDPDKERHRKEIDRDRDKITGRRELLERNLQQIEQQKAKATAEHDDLKGKGGNLKGVLEGIENEAIVLNARMDMLERSMQDVGVESKHLDAELNRVELGVSDGTVAIRAMGKDIRTFAKELGMSENFLEDMIHELDRLQAELRSGTLTADQYARKIARVRDIERAMQTFEAGIPNSGYYPEGSNQRNAQHGLGLVDSIIGASLLGSVISSGNEGRRTIRDRFRDLIDTRSLSAFFGNAVLRDEQGNVIRNTAGRYNRVPTIDNEAVPRRSGGGFFGRVKGGAKALGRSIGRLIPGVGFGLLALDAISVGTNVLGTMPMTEGDKLSIKADKLKDLENVAKTIDEGGLFGKIVGGINFANQAVIDGISNLLGGEAPSFKDYLDVAGIIMKHDGVELDKALKDRLKAEETAIQARVKQQEELNRLADPFDKDGDGKIDETLERGSMLMAVEDFQSMMAKLNEQLTRQRTTASREYEFARTRLALQGIREDSQEFRDLLGRFLTENIELLDAHIKELRERSELMADGEAKKAILQEIETKEIEKYQLEEQRKQNRDSELAAILNELNRDLEGREADWQIKRNEAIMAGAASDSDTVRAIERARANDISSRIERTQSQLAELLTQYSPQDSMYADILLESKKLEAEQTGILAEIAENTRKSQSTFNLPSGIKPMDYFEYRTRTATHRNATIRSGDIMVNVTIDNMNGTTEQAEQAATRIANAVRDAQNSFVNRFAQDVASGMGINYPGRR